MILAIIAGVFALLKIVGVFCYIYIFSAKAKKRKAERSVINGRVDAFYDEHLKELPTDCHCASHPTGAVVINRPSKYTVRQCIEQYLNASDESAADEIDWSSMTHQQDFVDYVTANIAQ